MNWEKFKHMFHKSWHADLQPFIESEECNKIYAFLKAESQKGKKIAPLSMNTYRCFIETPKDEVMVIMMGMCPYHTFTEGNPVADGLLMGCSLTGVTQPSLDQFYTGLEKEFYDGLNLHIDFTPDVTYLAKQGVLMFNAALTTEKDKAGVHLPIWEPFVKYMFENVFNRMKVPIIYLGKEAEKCDKYNKHASLAFPLAHPASASYRNTQWTTEGVFTAVNNLIYEKEKDLIQWLKVDLPF